MKTLKTLIKIASILDRKCQYKYADFIDKFVQEKIAKIVKKSAIELNLENIIDECYKFLDKYNLWDYNYAQVWLNYKDYMKNINDENISIYKKLELESPNFVEEAKRATDFKIGAKYIPTEELLDYMFGIFPIRKIIEDKYLPLSQEYLEKTPGLCNDMLRLIKKIDKFFEQSNEQSKNIETIQNQISCELVIQYINNKIKAISSLPDDNNNKKNFLNNIKKELGKSVGENNEYSEKLVKTEGKYFLNSKIKSLKYKIEFIISNMLRHTYSDYEHLVEEHDRNNPGGARVNIKTLIKFKGDFIGRILLKKLFEEEDCIEKGSFPFIYIDDMLDSLGIEIGERGNPNENTERWIGVGRNQFLVIKVRDGQTIPSGMYKIWIEGKEIDIEKLQRDSFPINLKLPESSYNILNNLKNNKLYRYLNFIENITIKEIFNKYEEEINFRIMGDRKTHGGESKKRINDNINRDLCVNSKEITNFLKEKYVEYFNKNKENLYFYKNINIDIDNIYDVDEDSFFHKLSTQLFNYIKNNIGISEIITSIQQRQDIERIMDFNQKALIEINLHDIIKYILKEISSGIIQDELNTINFEYIDKYLKLYKFLIQNRNNLIVSLSDILKIYEISIAKIEIIDIKNYLIVANILPEIDIELQKARQALREESKIEEPKENREIEEELEMKEETETVGDQEAEEKIEETMGLSPIADIEKKNKLSVLGFVLSVIKDSYNNGNIEITKNIIYNILLAYYIIDQQEYDKIKMIREQERQVGPQERIVKKTPKRKKRN